MCSDELTTIAQKAARGGLFLFIGNASSTVILAVGAIVVARLLGPFDYGLYTLTVTVPVLLVALADVGMNYALIRLPARLRVEGDHARANRLIKLGFLLKLTISTIASVVCYAGSTMIATIVLNRPELAPFIQLASLMIVFQAIFDATNNIFIGHDLMQYSASVQIMQAILKGTIAPVLVFVGLGITGAIWGYMFALAAAGLTGAMLLFTKHARSSGRPTNLASTELSTLLGYGLPLYAAAILGVFLTQYQNIVLAHFASNVEIGNFSATWTFTTFMMILVYPITTAMFPMFSKMDPRNQRGDLAKGFLLAVKYTSLLMMPASVAVMVFSRDLIYLTFGSSYAFASQYLVLLSALYLLTGIGYLILGSFLNGVALTGTVLRIGILTLAIYVPLCPALTWLWGPLGLLTAYILANTISTMYGVNRASVLLGARPDLKASGRILLVSLGAAVPTIALIRLGAMGIGISNLIVGGLFFLVIYLTLAPIAGAIDKWDISNLRSLLCRIRIVAWLANPVFDYEAKLLSMMGRGLRVQGD
jgi:O-antigen/teichoic acid export membrane protein